MVICEMSQCMGCAACENVCPKNAIHMSYNDEGFLYPVIADNECIGCESCVRICPANNVRCFYSPIKVFQGHSLNKRLLKDSTSGAVFSEIAEVILNDGGVIAGAFLDSTLHVKHIFIEDADELYKIRGSKYIGSDLSNIFKETKSRLKKGQKVLFSGTPCQIAALRNYIGDGFGNLLLCCDFICHGVGSQTLFDKYVHYYEGKKGSKVINAYFRNKKRSYINSSLVLVHENGKQSISPSYRNGFGYAFSKGMINRLSCSQCKFARVERVSDITLADCIHDIDLFEKVYGCSYILVNTNLGLDTLNRCELEIKEIDVGIVQKNQMHLNSPQKAHENRNRIMKDLEQEYMALYTTYFTPPRRNIVRAIKGRIRYARAKWRKG